MYTTRVLVDTIDSCPSITNMAASANENKPNFKNNIDNSTPKLSPESGNAWWFHSELTYPKELIDLPPLPSKNVIQWIPFGTHDVAHLEKAYQSYIKSQVRPVNNTTGAFEFMAKDELEVPERFVKVKCETRQYLKVDLERMRMGPIYWQGQEYLIRRSTWFLVPEGARITEGFPVERGLENLLTQRYSETISWIDRRGPEYSTLLECGPAENGGYDETIVEKIVPLIPEDVSATGGDFFSSSCSVVPNIQLHDPQAPDISRYFLVFRQGCNDYARLCVEKKSSGGGSGGKKGGRDGPIGKSPQMPSHSISPSSSNSSESPAVLPLDSINPISATSSVLSTSVSMTDLRETTPDFNSNAQNNYSNSNSNIVDNNYLNRSSMAASPAPSMNSPQSSVVGASGFHSFRIYRTYASFYHTLASGAEGNRTRVQTQRQTSEIEELKDTKTTKSAESSVKSAHATTTAASASSSASAAIDAAVAWKGVKAQTHSFKGHPLPSPEIPFDLMNESPGRTAKYVIFVVHGVGQRAFRKMGFHFNKDCDDMRNVLLDAAQARGLPPGSVVVLPVSWRAELNLAGNFTFGDDDFEEDQQQQQHPSDQENDNVERREGEGEEAGSFNSNQNDLSVDKDLEELQKSFNTKIDAGAVTYQRAVSVFEGQFTEILERLALESIPAVRSVLSDATMDILLYVSQKHFKKILGAVIKEVLRMHRLFAHWNPEYSGEFSFVAHSLGSALVADLLSFTVQPDEFLAKRNEKSSISSSSEDSSVNTFLNVAEGNVFPFKIDKFFAFGSPLGVFHLLKHTKPIGCLHSPYISAAIESRSRKWAAARRRPGGDKVKDVPAWTIYNCRLFYNVFHPHDPVAHRFESLSLLRGPSNRTSLSSLLNNAKDSNSSNSNNNSDIHTGGNTNNGLPPPLKIPYHKSGLTRFKMDLEAKIARAKDDWAKMTLKLPTWLGGKGEKPSTESTEKGEKSNEESSSSYANNHNNANSSSQLYDENPLAAFNHHFRRVDFSLQDAVMENAYISALGAHFMYWSDLDIAAFIVSELIKN